MTRVSVRVHAISYAIETAPETPSARSVRRTGRLARGSTPAARSLTAWGIPRADGAGRERLAQHGQGAAHERRRQQQEEHHDAELNEAQLLVGQAERALGAEIRAGAGRQQERNAGAVETHADLEPGVDPERVR